MPVKHTPLSAPLPTPSADVTANVVDVNHLTYTYPGGQEALRGVSLVGIILVAAYTIYSGIQFAWENWNALKLHQM